MTVETLGRAYYLYRRTASSRTAIVLLLANLIPLAGVVFFGWSLLTILVLYWLENGIVGFWNVPKIIMAQGSMIPRLPDLPESAAFAATGSATGAAALQEQWRNAQAAQEALASQETPATQADLARQEALATQEPLATQEALATQPPRAPAVGTQAPRPGLIGPLAAARLSAIPRAALAIFFTFHYGTFWLVHGIFVFSLPAFAGVTSFGSVGGSEFCLDPSGFPIECRSAAFGEVVWTSVVIGAIALFISHGASFLLNYIGRGEHLTASPAGQMGAVYGRVVVLHLTILLGAFVVAFLGSPIGALLVLVVLKTAFDLGLHLRERRRAAPPIPAAT